MNGTDLSCTENLSANIGKRGYRGITGPKGRPESYSTATAPDGQPGPDGTSRIDMSFNGENNEGFTSITSPRDAVFSYFIFPGITAWGTLTKFKLGVSLDLGSIRLSFGDVVTATIDVKTSDDTSIFSTPLTYSVTSGPTTNSIKKFHIVSNGDAENLYTTFTSAPFAESLLKVTCSTKITNNGELQRGNPTLEIYSLELI